MRAARPRSLREVPSQALRQEGGGVNTEGGDGGTVGEGVRGRYGWSVGEGEGECRVVGRR